MKENYQFARNGVHKMEDQKIIELYFLRDEKAIEVTNEKYGAYCTVVANNILADLRDSEECVSDTWLRAWNSIPPQRPSYLRLFLGKITRNLALDVVKRQGRKKRGSGEYELVLDELQDVANTGYQVEHEIERKELQKSINEFLRTIPERDCNVFLRRYFYFESTKQIADLYAIRESNVLGILSRTRHKLRMHLVQEGYWV